MKKKAICIIAAGAVVIVALGIAAYKYVDYEISNIRFGRLD